jgi:hypothetical protein
MDKQGQEPQSRFYMVVDAESDGITLRVPAITLPGLDVVTWEKLRIHNEVEAMDWPDAIDG